MHAAWCITLWCEVRVSRVVLRSCGLMYFMVQSGVPTTWDAHTHHTVATAFHCRTIEVNLRVLICGRTGSISLHTCKILYRIYDGSLYFTAAYVSARLVFISSTCRIFCSRLILLIVDEAQIRTHTYDTVVTVFSLRNNRSRSEGADQRENIYYLCLCEVHMISCDTSLHFSAAYIPRNGTCCCLYRAPLAFVVYAAFF